jgi:sensor histidine kinase regulating citrate/malate metabolism
MKNQLALQAQHYEHLTESIEYARAARHDLRHHLSVISDYAGKGDNAGLRAYLDEYIGGIPDEPLTPYCSNHAVNAVAQHYLAMAKQSGAKLDIRLRLPQDAGIPDSDLCIVFGNILENAAQSCARQEDGRRFIRAGCETAGGRLVFTVDNSVSDSRGEGVGQRSVRAVAKKYDGSAEFAREGDTYKTSVILLNPDA